jgi:hypothetical protein
MTTDDVRLPVSPDGQILHEKSLHPVRDKTAEWGELVHSFEALGNLRKKTEPDSGESITGQKSFYLPGGW